jgi:hypothetical protein
MAEMALAGEKGVNRMRTLVRFIADHEQNAALTIVFAVFLLGTALALRSGNAMRFPDELDYHKLAQSILAGDGYVSENGSPTAYRPPGWPYVLAAIYALSPHPLAVKLFNAAAYALTAWLLSCATAKFFKFSRIIAPLLMIMYPVGLYAASTLYPQTFGALLFLIVLLLLTRKNMAILSATVAGFVFGGLVLSIPAFLLSTPLLFIGMFLFRQCRFKLLFYSGSLFILLMSSVIAPWTIRNALVFSSFIPVSTNSGINMLLGNSKNTGPNSGVNVDISHYRVEANGMNEADKDRYFRRCALSWIKNNPGAATKLYALKVLNHFAFRNKLYVKSEGTHLRDMVMFFTYYPLLLIALVRLAWFRKCPLSLFETFLYIVYFGNAFVAAIYFTRIRFRLPFDPLLIGIVSLALGRWLQNTIEPAENTHTFEESPQNR